MAQLEKQEHYTLDLLRPSLLEVAVIVVVTGVDFVIFVVSIIPL